MNFQHTRSALLTAALMLSAVGNAHGVETVRPMPEMVKSQGQRFSIEIERVRPERVELVRTAIAIERVRPIRMADVVTTVAMGYTASAVSALPDDAPTTPATPQPSPADRRIPFDRSMLVPTGSRWIEEREQGISQPETVVRTGVASGSTPAATVFSGQALPMVSVGQAQPVATTWTAPVTTSAATPACETTTTACETMETSSAATGHCGAVETTATVQGVEASTWTSSSGVVEMRPAGRLETVATASETRRSIGEISSLFPRTDSTTRQTSQASRTTVNPHGWNLVATPLASSTVAASQNDETSQTSETLVVVAPATQFESQFESGSTISAPTTNLSTEVGLMRVVIQSDLAEQVEPDVETSLFVQAASVETAPTPAQAEVFETVQTETEVVFAGDLPEVVRESSLGTMTVVSSADMMPELEDVSRFVEHHAAMTRSAQAPAAASAAVPATAIAPTSEPVVRTTAADISAQSEVVVMGTMQEVGSETTTSTYTAPAEPVKTMSVREPSSVFTDSDRTEAVLAALLRQTVTADVYEDAQRRLAARREVMATPAAGEMALIAGDNLGIQIARSAGYLE